MNRSADSGRQMLVLVWVQYFFVSGSGIFGHFYHGRDFMYFYDGVQAWLAGRTPYSVHGFVTPPLSLVIPRLLAKLTYDRATEIFLM